MNKFYKFDEITKIEPFLCQWDGNRWHYLMTESEFKTMMQRESRDKVLRCLNPISMFVYSNNGKVIENFYL